MSFFLSFITLIPSEMSLIFGEFERCQRKSIWTPTEHRVFTSAVIAGGLYITVGVCLASSPPYDTEAALSLRPCFFSSWMRLWT